jgi:zinc protease
MSAANTARRVALAAAAISFLPSFALAQTAPLPAAKDLVAKHVAAIGGREAILRNPFFRAKGSFAMPAAGMTGQMEVVGAQPNLVFMKITIPGVGDMLQGFDGTHAWSLDPMQGPRLIEGEELAQMADEAEFASVLRESASIASMETTEIVTLGGQQCYKVKIVRKSGRETFDCYAVDSGLLIGGFAKQKTAMGEIEAVTEYTDYKEFNGIKQPTKVTLSMMGQQQVMEFTSYEYGPMEADVFVVPAPVATLIAQKTSN